MKTKLILPGLLALAGIHAQSAGWNWAVGLGGSGSDTGSAVVVHAATNILVTGFSSSGLVEGTNLPPGSFPAKLDPTVAKILAQSINRLVMVTNSLPRLPSSSYYRLVTPKQEFKGKASP